MKITIEGELPHLNDYTNANRTHYHSGAKLKKEATELVRLQALAVQKIKGGYKLGFRWTFPSRKVDPDNRIFAKKFILDGLQKAGVIENDSCKYFKGILYEDWEFGDTMKVVVEIVPA